MLRMHADAENGVSHPEHTPLLRKLREHLRRRRDVGTIEPIDKEHARDGAAKRRPRLVETAATSQADAG